MAKLHDIVEFLNAELEIDRFEDASHNGLQVQNAGKVQRVCCAVDASMETFRAAAAWGADLVVCHHGMSWGDSLKRITGLNYERLAFLMQHDIALYACHLPLDAHPRLGNNACIVKALGLVRRKPFGRYNGMEIGFRGSLPKPMRFDTFKKQVARIMQSEPRTMEFGPAMVRTVAVVSGGAAEEVDEAGRAGIDVYLSGEPKLMAYALAQEYAIHAVFAGHYATERFGVQAVGDQLEKQFKVKTRLLDFRIPF